MTDVALAFLTFSAAIWVGAIVYQSAVVAPTAFASLDEPATRKLLRALFPRFFRLGLICGLGMLLACLVLLAVAGVSETLVRLIGAVLVALCLQGVALWTVPRINAARDAGDAGIRRFKKLHALSVLTTLAVLVIGLAILVVVGDADGFIPRS